MYEYEKKLNKQGFKYIAGIDEAGRGCLAGPLVVAICAFKQNYKNDEINDSKKLSFIKRQKLFNQILNDAIYYDYIILNAKFVDIHNPKKSSIIGMEKLIEIAGNKIDAVLIDAEKIKNKIKNVSIIKGDQKSISIAAASIIAKVIRDSIMFKFDSKFNFKKHKGYGTKLHFLELAKYKPLKNFHRFSYKPVKNSI